MKRKKCSRGAITLPSTHFERGHFLSNEEEEKKNEKEKNSGGAITLPSTYSQDDEEENEVDKKQCIQSLGQ